jgi:hypothetical protein
MSSAEMQSASSASATVPVSASEAEDMEGSSEDYYREKEEIYRRELMELIVKAQVKNPLPAKEREKLKRQREFRDAVVMRLAWLELFFEFRILGDVIREEYKKTIGYATVRYGPIPPKVVPAASSAATVSATGVVIAPTGVSYFPEPGSAAWVNVKVAVFMSELITDVTANLSEHTGLQWEEDDERTPAPTVVDLKSELVKGEDTFAVQGERVSASMIGEEEIEIMTPSELTAYQKYLELHPKKDK